MILLPDAVEEIRDRGLALAQLDYIRPAVDDMRRYIDEVPDASDFEEIQAQLIELEQQIKHH